MQGVGWGIYQPDGATVGLLPEVDPVVYWVRLAQRFPVRIDFLERDPARPLRVGANGWVTFRKVTLPLLAPAILAGGLLAFALSVDDFVITYFNSGSEITFPVYVWGQAARGVPPQVNVIGSAIFFIAVGGRVPSYLGSSFAFIGPVLVATGAAAGAASPDIALALGGIIAAGVLYALIGFIVMIAGHDWIEKLMPPVLTGAIVAAIGLVLAPIAIASASGSRIVDVDGIEYVDFLGDYSAGLLGHYPSPVSAAVPFTVNFRAMPATPAVRRSDSASSAFTTRTDAAPALRKSRSLSA